MLISFFYFVSLDPCEDMTCSFNAICVVDRNFRASCQCPKCPPTRKQVCGSDGNTYVNECELRKQSCTTKTNITILHGGECGKLFSLCSVCSYRTLAVFAILFFPWYFAFLNFITFLLL